jgi:hypothetical protein
VPTREEDENHHHDQYNGQHQFELHVTHRCANAGRPVRENAHVDGGRQTCLQLRQDRLDAIDRLNDVRTGLPLDIDDDGRNQLAIARPRRPRGELQIFGVFDNCCDVRKAQR